MAFGTLLHPILANMTCFVRGVLVGLFLGCVIFDGLFFSFAVTKSIFRRGK